MFKLKLIKDSCIVFPKFRGIINHCRNNYNWNDDDTKDYLKGWIKVKSKEDMESATAETGADANSSETLTTTTPPPTTTTARPIIPPSQRKKSKYKCQHAWCYQVN